MEKMDIIWTGFIIVISVITAAVFAKLIRDAIAEGGWQLVLAVVGLITWTFIMLVVVVMTLKLTERILKWIERRRSKRR